MRRILVSTFVLALLAVAVAAPPIDYELTCGEEGPLVGVLSLTEGKVHVALVEGATCDVPVVVDGPDGAPAVVVDVDWDGEAPSVGVTVDDAEVAEPDLVIVPQVAIDGMLNAQRLRTAAMEMRREAAERGVTDRDRVSWDDPEGDVPPGDGPPADVPPGDGPGGPPDETPRGEGPGGRP